MGVRRNSSSGVEVLRAIPIAPDKAWMLRACPQGPEALAVLCKGQGTDSQIYKAL